MLRLASTDSPDPQPAGIQETVPAQPDQPTTSPHVRTSDSESQPVREATMPSVTEQPRLPQDLNLQSPFAAAEVQHSCRRPQDLDAQHTRKRARHLTPEINGVSHSKLQHLATHFKQTAPHLLSQSDPIMIHRPTAQRPAAGAACSFGLQAFTPPPVSSLHAFNPAQAPVCNPIQLPASCAFVPDSLATAAALANVINVNMSQAADLSKQYQYGVPQPDTSADNRALQRPAASDSSSSAEVVSDNSQTLSVKAQSLHAPGLVPCPNLSNISTQTNGRIQAQPFNHSPTYLATQHMTPAPTLMNGTSLAPFTTYGGFPGSFPHSSALQPTTYVVVSGNSPKRAASPTDKYVAAVVQDAQGNSQHVTVPASAISTGGPSYVLPATSTIPVNPIGPFLGPQTIGFGTASQHSFLQHNAFAQPMAGLGSMLGVPGVWPSIGLSLPTPFGITQPALSAMQRFPPPLLPSMHVVPDKSHCVSATANVRIY